LNDKKHSHDGNHRSRAGDSSSRDRAAGAAPDNPAAGNAPDNPAAGAAPDQLHGENEPVELPIDGELDLHHFHPRDVKELVPDYLDECRRRGILQVRIVHGKGTGALRETVHAVLKKLPYVTGFRSGGSGGGSWGATIANLSPLDDDND
jgi:DNA-nicking Smr family endonuclease